MHLFDSSDLMFRQFSSLLAFRICIFSSMQRGHSFDPGSLGFVVFITSHLIAGTGFSGVIFSPISQICWDRAVAFFSFSCLKL